MKNYIALFVFLVTLVSCAQERPSVHDPVVAKQGDTYYLFCTGMGISSWTSKDLKTWEKGVPVHTETPEWTNDVVPGFRGHMWAPDITFHNGKYYLYYSVSAFGKNTSAIGLATNSTLNPEDPNYKWEDQGMVIQSAPNRDLWNAIDPNLVFDDNGTPWLSFGSFWSGLKIVKLEDDLKTLAQPQEWYPISRRGRSLGIPDPVAGDAPLEAPFIFKKDGYYYQFLSWDYCCRGEDSTYKVVVGRSKNVTGPYFDKEGKDLNDGGGTLFIEGNKNWYGVGHNSVYSFDGKVYNFMHGYDASDEGRSKLLVKEVTFVDGWPEIAPMD